VTGCAELAVIPLWMFIQKSGVVQNRFHSDSEIVNDDSDILHYNPKNTVLAAGRQIPRISIPPYFMSVVNVAGADSVNLMIAC
jgi:hypothetical protein